MSGRCPKCKYEKPKPNEAVTLYAGKMFCDCDNGNMDGKVCKVRIPTTQSQND